MLANYGLKLIAQGLGTAVLFYYFIIFIITMSIETFLFSFLVLYKSKGNKEESLTELPQVLIKNATA